jgi:hypothetical protein
MKRGEQLENVEEEAEEEVDIAGAREKRSLLS